MNGFGFGAGYQGSGFKSFPQVLAFGGMRESVQPHPTVPVSILKQIAYGVFGGQKKPGHNIVHVLQYNILPCPYGHAIFALTKQEDLHSDCRPWGFKRPEIQETPVGLFENLSFSFGKYVYYGTSFNMY